jgi:16S rRNA (cytosine967-C5)-methyltransferase
MNKHRNIAERILDGAVSGLAKWESGQANIDDYLSFHLSDPELRRSISSLLFEYFRHKPVVDRLLDSLISTRCQPEPRRILTAAVTQILYQDGIAAESAVNVAVDFAKQRCRPAAGFINAVLRNVTRMDFAVFAAELSAVERAGFPEELHRHWRNIFPESFPQLEALLQQRAILSFRACRRPLSESEVEELEAIPVPSEGFYFYRTENVGNLIQSEALKSGRIYIQDAATALAPTLAVIQPGERVADLCAAPGGKSLMLLERLNGSGKLTVADRSENRQKLTEQNLRLRGYDIPVETASVLEPPYEDNAFDAVLLDVPCSNTGVFHRRPDVLWSFSDEKVRELTELQMSILMGSARLVRPGGRIIYSTCSIEPRENSRLVRRFMAEKPAFELVRSKLLIPDKLHDGAYAAVLQRNS